MSKETKKRLIMENPKPFVTSSASEFESEGAKYTVDSFTTLDMDNNQTIRNSEPYFSFCSHCNLSFENLIEFEHHNAEMHSQRKLHKCYSCDAIFKRQDHLKRHIQSLHSSSNEKNCFCPVCEEDCLRRDLLLKHIRKKHTSNCEVFKCRLCDFKCTSLSGLEKHEVGHSKTERHICPHCDTTFKRRDHMLRHVKSQHLNEMVSCPLCGQVYKRKDHVARHVREKHQMGFFNGRLVKSVDIVQS